MPLINGMPVSNSTGRAVAVEAVAGNGEPYLTGIRYLDDTGLGKIHIIEGATPAGCTIQGGFLRDPQGNLVVFVDETPSAPNRVYNAGLLCDLNGRLCLTQSNGIAGYVAGWPVDSLGQLCVGTSTPIADFYELEGSLDLYILENGVDFYIQE